MTGPMKGQDGTEIPPTRKSYEVDFCTVARWDHGQIVRKTSSTTWSSDQQHDSEHDES
jgi:hypothetical protein